MFLYLVVKVKTFEYHSKSINQDFKGQKKKKSFVKISRDNYSKPTYGMTCCHFVYLDRKSVV